MIEIKKTICPLDCPDSCAIVATLKEGRIIKLDGDPDHEITRGFLCRKMRRYHERVQSEDRILNPMKRSGTKGSGKFDAISWEEAWQILVGKLKEIKEQYGGEALLPYSYAGNMGIISRSAGNPFFHRYGASRLDHTICSSAASAGWQAHLGNRPGTDPLKAADAEVIIAWGINVKVTNIHFWPIIQESRRRGGRLVVIDPYRNVTAKAADYYFPVKPAGDTALALGIIKTIIGRGKADQDFIREHTTGFDALKTHVDSVSWENIEEISGIPEADIGRLADLLIAHPKTFFRIGIGLTRNTSGAMSIRTICSLAAILGLPDGRPGRGLLLSSGAFSGNDETINHTSLAERKTRLVNMVQLGHALTALKPAIHGLFVFNSNPLSVAPDASMVKQGLKREDLFTIVHEQVMTPTAKYADLVLPATTSFENKDLYKAYGNFDLGMTEPVIKPRGEAIDNFTLFQTLADKMGYDDTPFKQTLEDRILAYLSDLKGLPDDFDFASFQSGCHVKSIRANSRNWLESAPKIAFVSGFLPPDQPGVPCLLSTGEFDNPDLKSRYPLKLIVPPKGELLNSTFGDRYINECGFLLIHPEDAEQRGIRTDRLVKIISQRGLTIRKAKVTLDAQKGVVIAEGIYWENPEKGYDGINTLTSQKTTDLGGGGTFHESLVEVSPG
ncbi:molybdopterin-dependent oxidoreductase [bacterium]|nr:molybdopterin-dependent oxidoreductase [bacterium]